MYTNNFTSIITKYSLQATGSFVVWYFYMFSQRVQEGDEPVVLYILSQSPGLVNGQSENSGLRPLHVAARYNQPNIVRILLKKGAG